VPDGAPLVQVSPNMYFNLADWQAARGQDLQTQIYNPIDDWMTTSDLHLRHSPGLIAPAIVDGRTADMLFDVDFEPRNLAGPDRGADEFVPPTETRYGAAVIPNLFATKTQSGRRVRTRNYVKAGLHLKNIGTGEARQVRVQLALSDDPQIDGFDRILRNYVVRGLGAGRTKSISLNIAMHNKTSGKYLLAVVDPERTVINGEDTSQVAVYGPLP